MRCLLGALLTATVATLALSAAQTGANALIANAGWECVPNATLNGDTLAVTGGASASTTVNDNAIRLETRPSVAFTLTLEATGAGFSGIYLWQSVPPPGDAANWYATSARVAVGLQGGRPALRVYDGRSNTPAFQFTSTSPPSPGAVSLNLAREGDALVLRVAGVEAARTNVLGSLAGGPVFFGAATAANATLTVRRFDVADADVVHAVSPASPSSASTTLKSAAASRGREIGVGLSQRPFRWDQRVRDVAAREFNLFSGIDEFIFDTVRPARDQYRFCGADQLVAFAEANHTPVHAGSGLLWGRNPAWLTDGHFSRAELVDILRDQIHAVVGRYRGRVHVWNVVNEVHDNTGGFQQGDQQIWMRVIGPEYIDMAFRFAHEADPQAVLLFNSVNDEGAVCLEQCGPGRASNSPNLKADALYRTVKDLVARGIPINGVGMQTHWGDFDRYPMVDPKSVGAQMKRLGDLGLSVYITEMDVPVQAPVTSAKLSWQADRYTTMLRACLAAPNCKSLIVFGVDDGHWSVPPSFARAGNMAGGLVAPLLFDSDFRSKPAYEAMLSVLQGR